MKTTSQLVLFYGGPFSQWYPTQITIDGTTYNTAEQFMMAMKAQYFGDLDTKAKIMATKDPGEQKRLGRQVKNFEAPLWQTVGPEYVYMANLAKFSEPTMKLMLLGTGDKEIAEASPYDSIWGIGLSENDPRALDKSQWRGTNLLGEAIMRVRNDLRKVD